MEWSFSARLHNFSYAVTFKINSLVFLVRLWLPVSPHIAWGDVLAYGPIARPAASFT